MVLYISDSAKRLNETSLKIPGVSCEKCEKELRGLLLNKLNTIAIKSVNLDGHDWAAYSFI